MPVMFAGKISGRTAVVIIVRGSISSMHSELKKARATLYGLNSPDWTGLFQQFGIIDVSSPAMDTEHTPETMEVQIGEDIKQES